MLTALWSQLRIVIIQSSDLNLKGLIYAIGSIFCLKYLVSHFLVVSSRCEIALHLYLIYIFLVTICVAHLFTCLLAIFLFLFLPYLFPLPCLFFPYWFIEISTYILIQYILNTNALTTMKIFRFLFHFLLTEIIISFNMGTFVILLYG